MTGRTVCRAALFAALLVAGPALAKAPRLTLFISVDSLSSDLLLRSRPRLKGGLSQLVNQGAYFPYARYGYAEVATAAGHATLSTGANPWRHGIVANRLINRTTGKEEPVMNDPNHPVLEAPLSVDDVSPQALLAETVSDRLMLSTYDKGKSVALSGKGRASIALAGRLGKAWWFHEGVGKFVTGTYYEKEFPAWVKAFNEKKAADSFFGKEWALSAPAKEYLGDDDRPFESDLYAMGRTFPHVINGGLPGPGAQYYAAMASSPFMNDLLVQFAKATLEGEAMGKDDVPDLLQVSFSATDRIYHLYGPYSWEAQDGMLRLDKAIGDLIAAAEKAAGGRGNLLVMLSADHGGAGAPEEWAAAGLTAVRVNPTELKAAVNKELSAKFAGGEFVLGIEELDAYLSDKLIADKKLDGVAVRRAAAAAFAKHPAVAFAVARDDLATAVDPGNAYLQALRRGYYPERSGDVLFVVKPYHVVTDYPTGTSHGTPYSYDVQVPFALLGKGVKPGVYLQEIEVTDIAPTLAAALEIGIPASAEGKPRAEALTGK